MNAGLIPILFNNPIPQEYKNYAAYVAAQAGSIYSTALTQKIIKFYKDQGRYNDIKLLWTATGGTLVQSGTNPLQISKAYSADSLTTHNDLTQATSLSQPYGVGRIQNIPSSLYKPNGSIKNMSHPEISFAADQEWCITIVFNYNGNSPVANAYFLGKSGATSIGIWYNGTIVFYSGGGGRFSTKITNNFIGKNTILSFVYNGTPALKLYVNGEYWDAITVPVTSFITDTLFVINTYSGSISHICLNQFASITASQVAAEHAILRSIYPEIPSVVIGSQEWAVDNFRAVATPLGNVIANVTENGAVEKITNAADREFSSDTGFWSKNAGVVIEDGVCKFNSTGIGLGIYKSGTLIVNKYYKVKLTISNYTSGAVSFQRFFDSPLLNSNGAHEFILKASSTTMQVWASLNNTTLHIDDISFKELNWSNATEIYDAVYAATAGTTAEKEYAALKEAAMWCSYNNDPANDVIYSKLFNKYAMLLYCTDFLSASYGYHIPSKAESAILPDSSGLKLQGGSYWNDDLGTNETNLCLLGTGVRMPDGTFSSLKSVGGFWDSDSNDLPTIGLPIRIIKD